MAKYQKEERIPPSLQPNKAINLLRKQKEKIDELLQKRHDDPDVIQWKNGTEECIRNAFGSPCKNLFDFMCAEPTVRIGMSDRESQENFISGLHKRKKLLEGFIERLEDPGEGTTEADSIKLRGDKVFFAYASKKKDIVNELVRHVETRHGIKAVLMEEEPHEGRLLPEKFEELGKECGFGVFVLTADDECVISTPTGEKRVRYPRQNVILELGYFWGKLGRKKRIAVLVEDGVETPTDINALGWIPITGDLGDTKLKLTQELEKAEIVRKN